MMNRKVFILLAIISIALLLSAGCGNGDNGEDRGPGGRIPDDTSEPEIIFIDITEDEIGVPIYPGAPAIENTLRESSETYGENAYQYVDAVLSTNDTVDEVTAWYREALSGRPGFEEEKISYPEGDEHVFFFDADDCRRIVTVGPSRDFRLGLTLVGIVSEALYHDHPG